MQGLLYFPLNRRAGHIRLIMLYPGRFADDIECSLLQAPLDHFKRYEALSYTWGAPDKTSSVLLKGHRFPVTRNLEAALRHLRYEAVPGRDNARLLWIDAICINQDDLEERNLQVRRMPDIYQAAERVVGWLGEGTAETDLGMDFMNQYAERAIGFDEGLLRARAHREEYLAVATILTRPWWQRMWVIQEAALAKDMIIVCGSKSAPWRTVTLFSDIAHLYHKAAIAEVLRRFDRDAVRNSNMGSITSAVRKDLQAGKYWPIHRLITRFRSFQSTLPVDKVYGILGIAAESQDPSLDPDYSRPVNEVYKQFTRFIIEKEMSLNFICTSFGPKKLDGLPSWTPDFTVPNIDIVNPLKGLDGLFTRMLYSTARQIPMSVRFSSGLDSMHVSGVHLDHISHIANYWDPDLSYDDFWEGFPPIELEWRTFAARASNSIFPRYRADRLNLAISKTLTADRMMDSRWTISRLPPDQSFKDLSSLPAVTYDVPGSQQLRQIQHDYDVKQLLEGALSHRRFMVSQTGYIGLVPEDAQVQDLICVLFGCDTPVILRQQDGHTLFIGEW